MHPVSKVYFGDASGQIRVRFHNGSSVVTGYIVKQIATKKYIVTANGTDMFTVALAADGTPAAGEMTINLYPVVNGVQSTTAKQVKKLLAFQAITTDGGNYAWKLTPQTKDGYAQLEVIP